MGKNLVLISLKCGICSYFGLACNPVVLKKKIGTNSKKLLFLGPICTNWGNYGPRPK